MGIKEQIRASAIKLAREKGLVALTIRDLCEACDIPEGSFQFLAEISFKELMESLLDEDVPVCIEGGVIKCRAVSPKLRRAHLVEIGKSIAKKSGVESVTFESLAEAVGMHRQSIIKSIGSIIALREEIKKGA